MTDPKDTALPTTKANPTIKFPRAITTEQVKQLNEHFENHVITHRLALIVMSRTSDELIAGYEQDPDLLVDSLQNLQSFSEFLAHCADFVNTAHTRCLATGTVLVDRMEVSA